jgi:hypothetical protein
MLEPGCWAVDDRLFDRIVIDKIVNIINILR